MTEKKNPDWFAPWKDAGFIRPETAKKWLISGFKPDTAAPWYDLDEVEVHIASDWVKQGFTPGDYLAWTRKGFRGPVAAAAWRRHFPDPTEAEKWRSLGLRIDGNYGELLQRGYDPQIVLHAEITNDEISIDQLTNWLDNFDDVERLVTGDLRVLYATGLSPEEIKYLSSRSMNVSLAAKFRNMGWALNDVELLFEEWGGDVILFSRLGAKSIPRNVLGWTQLEVSAQTAIDWINEGADPATAKSWFDIGITNANFAAKWSKDGCGPDEVLALRHEGWSNPGDFSRMKLKGWWIEDILKFLDFGIPRSSIDAWLSHNKMGYERWKTFLLATVRGNAMEKWLNSQIGVEEWPAWIDYVSPEPEICVQWKTTGFTPQKIGEMLRASGSPPDDFDKSLSGHQLLAVLNTRNKYIERNYVSKGNQAASVDKRTPERDFGRANSSSPVLESKLSESAIEEFQAKAVYLSNEIKKIPPVGMEFIDESNGIIIKIKSIGVTIKIEVILGTKKLLIEFDSNNFDSVTKLSSQNLKIAYVLALSWFVDCAVTLKAKYRTANRNFETQPGGSFSGQTSAIRYVPTMQFSSSIREVRNGNGVSPVLHQVSGHIRRLPPGKSPSEEAVGRAPGFLRRKMGVDDTFVVGHTRGFEKEVEEFAIRLSKYSMTAHAFAAVIRS